jgi:hypothetical protein
MNLSVPGFTNKKSKNSTLLFCRSTPCPRARSRAVTHTRITQNPTVLAKYLQEVDPFHGQHHQLVDAVLEQVDVLHADNRGREHLQLLQTPALVRVALVKHDFLQGSVNTDVLEPSDLLRRCSRPGSLSPRRSRRPRFGSRSRRKCSRGAATKRTC